MIQGDETTLIRTPNGQLMAFATGSDPCTEHEQGTAALQAALCSGFSQGDAEEDLLEALRNSDPVTFDYPQLLPRKRINKNLDKIQLHVGTTSTGENVAVMGYSPSPAEISLTAHPLSFFTLRTGVNAVSAWDEESFAIKVRGKKQVELLKQFHTALLNGEGVFAGTFLKKANGGGLSGVMIALEPLLLPEHLAAIKKAQQTYQDNLLLKARSRVKELHHAASTYYHPKEKHRCTPGYIWPVWKDGKVGAEVLYRVNPDHGVKMPYGTTLTFDEMMTWICAEVKPTY